MPCFQNYKICIMITVIFLTSIYWRRARIDVFYLHRLSSCHLHSVASFTCRTFPVAHWRTCTNRTFHVLILISFDKNKRHISSFSVHFKYFFSYFFFWQIYMFINIYKSSVVSVCISRTKVSRKRHNLIIFGSSMKQ